MSKYGDEVRGSGVVQSPIEMPNVLEAPGSGPGGPSLLVRPETFEALDAACATVIDALADARERARLLGDRSVWGLGEDDERLWTAVELVTLLREKGAGGPDNARDTLEAYRAAAETIRAQLVRVRTELAGADADFARRVTDIPH